MTQKVHGPRLALISSNVLSPRVWPSGLQHLSNLCVQLSLPIPKYKVETQIANMPSDRSLNDRQFPLDYCHTKPVLLCAKNLPKFPHIFSNHQHIIQIISKHDSACYSTKCPLSMMKDLAEVDDSWVKPVKVLEEKLGGPLEQLHSLLEDLPRRLSPLYGLRKMNKAVMWPFKKEQVHQILDTLQRINGVFLNYPCRMAIWELRDISELPRAIDSELVDLKRMLSAFTKVIKEEPASSKLLCLVRFGKCNTADQQPIRYATVYDSSIALACEPLREPLRGLF